MIAMSGMGMHCTCHPGSRTFALLMWLLMRMLMGVRVIHVVLSFAATNSNAFGAFMQKLFRSDYSSTPDLAA